jgi:hypothetical protein
MYNEPSKNPILRNRPDINPYRHSLSSTLNRLKWDINPESWRSRRKIKQFESKYLNKKAVIICNGPSLLKSDFSLLNNIFTFGLNKINLLFEKTDFRPSCIVSVNPLVIEQNSSFYNQTTIPLFLDSFAVKFVGHSSTKIFFHSYRQDKFARDCSISIYPGYTVTFVAMQLAFYMGFSDVTLIGCDHSFSNKGPSNMKVISGEKDHDHFDPNYFAGGLEWQLPDLAGSEYNYSKAKSVYEASGRRLVNSTEGGELELLPRVPLEEFILGC